jgi:hypothetical protein
VCDVTSTSVTLSVVSSNNSKREFFSQQQKTIQSMHIFWTKWSQIMLHFNNCNDRLIMVQDAINVPQIPVIKLFVLMSFRDMI